MPKHYSLRPGLGLRLSGPAVVERHFAQEYGDDAATPATNPAVDVRFEPVRAQPGDGTLIAGGHKTVRWRVALSAPQAQPLAASIELGGRPRFFVISLVQGYFVEPLLSIAAARIGEVLLPAAAIADGDGALVLIGASASGKSSLVARAVARGRPVLGDDQIFLGPGGLCRRFPRRMRFYWDLRRVAPDAYAQLPRRHRVELGWRTALRHATRGYLRPSLAVSHRAFGVSSPSSALPVKRVIVLDRSGATAELVSEPIELDDVVRTAQRLLERQRERLDATAGAEWHESLAAVSRTEGQIVREALAGAPAERLLVPDRWEAPQAVARLARELGVEA